MSVARTVLLKISDNQWLRANGTRVPFVRRAVSKFMPGESFDDMLVATQATAGEGIGAVFTRLGENVKDLAEAEAVARHYLEVIDRIRALGISCEPSIKLTQLGLDIDRELAYGHLRDLAVRAQAAGSYLWVDMEQSSYVDVTLDLTRRLKQEFPAVGVCLQAYLFRTRQDLEDLLSRGIGVRLVKGAYNEPAAVAFPKKSDVDANYFALAQLMLGGCAGLRIARGIRHPRSGSDLVDPRARAIDGSQARRLRISHVVRHPEGRAAAAGAGRRAGARPDRLRRVLVPLVYAPAGRAARQRVVRREESIRLISSTIPSAASTPGTSAAATGDRRRRSARRSSRGRIANSRSSRRGSSDMPLDR